MNKYIFLFLLIFFFLFSIRRGSAQKCNDEYFYGFGCLHPKYSIPGYKFVDVLFLSVKKRKFVYTFSELPKGKYGVRFLYKNESSPILSVKCQYDTSIIVYSVKNRSGLLLKNETNMIKLSFSKKSKKRICLGLILLKKED